MGFACLFITHDLSTVEFFCDRVAVMYLGKVMEMRTREQVFTDPRHPYTQALLSAALVPHPAIQRTRSRVVLAGDIPSPSCRFRTRCPLEGDSTPQSTDEEPLLHDPDGDGHVVACHLVRRGEAPRLVDPVTPGAG